MVGPVLNRKGKKATPPIPPGQGKNQEGDGRQVRNGNRNFNWWKQV